MTNKEETWRDTFHFVVRAPEGKARFNALVPGYKPLKGMDSAMAYMYSAWDPIAEKHVRITFATAADIPQEEADKIGERIMENKIRGNYDKIAKRLIERAL